MSLLAALAVAGCGSNQDGGDDDAGGLKPQPLPPSSDAGADADAGPPPDLDVTIVKDINTRSAGSSPQFLLDGSSALFGAIHGASNEIWKTDGTPAGTQKLVTLPSTASEPYLFAKLGSKILFSTSTLASGGELWVSDGTDAGTSMLVDIVAGSGSSSPNPIGKIDDTFYFTASDGSKGHVWKTDGTPTGTVQAFSTAVANVAILGRTFYFGGGASGLNGSEPWVSDGTEAGTHLLLDVNPNAGSNPGQFMQVGSHVVFLANDGTHGNELWVTDGTTAGTHLLVDFVPGAGSVASFLQRSQLGLLGANLFFTCQTPSQGRELCKTDGTAAGTVVVDDIAPGAGSSNPNYLTAYGSRIYFFANDGTNGNSLWSSDGTAAGTKLVKTISPPSVASFGQPIVVTTNGLVFAANDGLHGLEPFRSDGTANGTAMISDVFPGLTSSLVGGTQMMSLGGAVVFAASDPTTDPEPYAVSADLQTATRLDDVNDATANGVSSAVFSNGNRLFFSATDGATSSLWSSDGTESGTKSISSAPVSPGASPFVDGALVYFCANDPVTGSELWVTNADGTSSAIVSDIAPGTAGGCTVSPTASVGDTVYFLANDGTNGQQVWRSQGTAATTSMATTPSDSGFSVSSSPIAAGNFALVYAKQTGDTFGSVFALANGQPAVRLAGDGLVVTGATSVGASAYFIGSNTANGQAGIFRTDGTLAGTKLVVTGNFDSITASGNDLVLSGDTASWVWDTTTNAPFATMLVAAAPDAPTYSAFPHFGSYLGKTFFVGGNGTDGFGPWTSDLTPQGTSLIASLLPRNYGSWAMQLGSKMYFSQPDVNAGNEIYSTDGTPGGTHLAVDIFPGGGNSNSGQAFVIGDAMYFSADDSRHGIELMKATRHAP